MGTGQIMNQPGTMGFVPMPSGAAMGAGYGHHPAMIRGGGDVGPGGQRHLPGAMMHPGYQPPYPAQAHPVSGVMMVPGGTHQMMPPPGRITRPEDTRVGVEERRLEARCRRCPRTREVRRWRPPRTR